MNSGARSTTEPKKNSADLINSGDQRVSEFWLKHYAWQQNKYVTVNVQSIENQRAAIEHCTYDGIDELIKFVERLHDGVDTPSDSARYLQIVDAARDRMKGKVK